MTVSKRAGFYFVTALGAEVTYVNSTHLLHAISCDVGFDRPAVTPQYMTTNLTSPQGLDNPPGSVKGSLQAEMTPKTSGVLLKALFNEETTVSSGTALKTRTFKPFEQDPWAQFPNRLVHVYREAQRAPSFTNARWFGDCCLDSVEFTIKAGESLKMGASFIGTGITPPGGSASTDDPPEEPPFLWNTCSLSINNFAGYAVEDLSIKVQEPIGISRFIGSLFADRIIRKGYRKINISGNLIITSKTLETALFNDTAQSLMFFVEGRDVESGIKESLKIDIPRFKFTSYPIPVSGNGGEVKVQFAAEASYDNATSKIIEITHVSTVSALL